jgi:hypothetical protein
MAVTAGRNGAIKIEFPSADLANPATTVTNIATMNTAMNAAVVFGQVRSWSLEETVDTLDATVMSSSTGFIFRDVLPSFKSWTASVDFIYDPADTGQGNVYLKAGNTVNIGVFPEGDVVTEDVWGGKAMITAISQSASFDGLVEATITCEGRATLVRGATT